MDQRLRITTYPVGLGETRVSLPGPRRFIGVRPRPDGEPGALLVVLAVEESITGDSAFLVVPEDQVFEHDMRILHHLGEVQDAVRLHVFLIAPPSTKSVYNLL